MSDELLAELRRRACVTLRRRDCHLPSDAFFRAAADLCGDAMRDVSWKRLDVKLVCSWHGIELATGSAFKLRQLHELRRTVRGFGPLEGLLTSSTWLERLEEPERRLISNLQLLLQTPR